MNDKILEVLTQFRQNRDEKLLKKDRAQDGARQRRKILTVLHFIVLVLELATWEKPR